MSNMIDFVQGEYILVEMTNFSAYLLAIGTFQPRIHTILSNPTRVKIMNPTNPQSPNPGHWCFNEDFGGFKSNFVIDQSKDHIEINETIGSQPVTMNRFGWQQGNILKQCKVSDLYACVIMREFEEGGFKMELLNYNSNHKACLTFQRL